MEVLTPEAKKKKSILSKIFGFWATGKDKEMIEDQGEVDSLYKKYRLQIMIFLTLGYGAYYVCRLGMSVIKKPLIDNGVFSAEELGLIGSALFYGYAVGKLTNGFLADHSNTRKLMVTGLLISAICNIVMGCSTALTVFIAMWAFNGWFQGFGAASSVVTLTHWFSNHERGTRYGIWSASHSVGEGLTFIFTAMLVEYLGWRSGFIGAGLFCVGMAALLWIFLKDRPRTLGLPAVADWKNDYSGNVKPKSDRTSFVKQIQILRYPAVWILCLASASMYVTRYAVNNWSILYLQEARDMSIQSASFLLAVNTVAGIVGSVAYGFISDRFFNSRRPPVNLIFGLFEIAALIVIFYLPANNFWIMAVAFAIYGFTLSGLLAVLGGLFAVDVVPKNAAGAVLGFVGIFSYLGAAVQEQVSGYLIGKNSELVNGVRVYDFSSPIIFWIAMSVVSMLLAASLWNTKMKD